jgi:glycosyltransferase involved in cell wall biosynthesis
MGALGVNARPRVAVVYPIPFGEEGTFGGGERYALELARALARRVPTRLLTFGAHGGERCLDGLSIRTYQPLLYVQGARLNPLSLRFLGALRDADVVHCVSWNTLVTDFAILAARALGKRVFVTDVGGGAGVTLNRWLPLARLVDGFLLIAPQGGEQFERFRGKWGILYGGVDLDRYRPDPALGRRGVLFVGRILPHKGINYLVEAIEPGVPLRIVGRAYDAEFLALLRRLAAGKDVTFVTDASDEEVIREYQSCAVSVLPSVYKTVYGDTTEVPELLGFTALEAMACGAPVLATNVCALPEVVVDGVTGFLVSPNDSGALRARIRRLLDDPGEAARLGAAARRRVAEQFTWERTARRCLEAYASAAPAGRSRDWARA